MAKRFERVNLCPCKITKPTIIFTIPTIEKWSSLPLSSLHRSEIMDSTVVSNSIIESAGYLQRLPLFQNPLSSSLHRSYLFRGLRFNQDRDSVGSRHYNTADQRSARYFSIWHIRLLSYPCAKLALPASSACGFVTFLSLFSITSSTERREEPKVALRLTHHLNGKERSYESCFQLTQLLCKKTRNHRDNTVENLFFILFQDGPWSLLCCTK